MKKLNKYKFWIAGIVVLSTIIGIAYAHTNSTIVSRLKLDHPDLGYEGGAGLHAKVQTAWIKIGDNMNSRYNEYTSVANSTTTVIEHNFGAVFAEYRVLLYSGTGTSKTRITDPVASGWTIIANITDPTTKIDITTPGSGGPHNFSVIIIHGRGAENLDDLDDVDTTGKEDGQALVWVNSLSKWTPGASGDSSFKLQSVATSGVYSLKGGYLILTDGRELATYDGSGSDDTDFGTDISGDLDNLEGSPVNDTSYYLYIDLNTLPSVTTTTTKGRKIYGITETQLILSTVAPDSMILSRYIPIGLTRRGTGAWSASAYTDLARRQHNNLGIVASPLVYSLEDYYIGTPGVKAGLGELTSARLKTGSTTSNTSFYNLDTVSDDYDTRDLTNNGTLAFEAPGLWRGNVSPYRVARFDGSNDYLSSTNVFFNPGNGKSYAFGGWFYPTNLSGTRTLIANVGGGSDKGYQLVYASGNLYAKATNTGASWDTTLTVPVAWSSYEWHHLIVVFDYSTTKLKLYIDGNLASSATLANTRTVTSSAFMIGADTGATNLFIGNAQDIIFVNDLLYSDADVAKLYGSTTPDQLSLGHILARDSFASKYSDSQLVWWNLAADVNDDSGNSKTLTNVGTATFTATNAFGDANAAASLNGSSQCFSSTDDFFNPGDANFTTGGYFRMSDWTPSAAGMLIVQAGSAAVANQSFSLGVTTAGYLEVYASDGTTNSLILDHDPVFLDGTYHRIDLSYFASDNTFKLYVDGNFVSEGEAPSNITTAGTDTFSIGCQAGSSTLYTKADIHDEYFVLYRLSDTDIKKLSSAKIAHNKNVASDRQDWEVTVKKANGEYVNFNKDAVIDKSSANNAYINLNALATNQTDIKYFKPSFTATSVDPTLGSGGDQWASITRDGKFAHIEYRIKFGTGMTPGTGTYKFGLPTGITIDKAALIATNVYPNLGEGWVRDTTGLTVYNVLAQYEMSSNYIYLFDGNARTDGAIGAAVPMTFAQSDIISFRIKIPIKTWSIFNTKISPTDRVSFKLKDNGLSNVIAVPIQSAEFTFESTPTLTGTTYPTNLAQAPRSFSIQQKLSSEWKPQDAEGLISTTDASPYYLRGDLSSLSCSAPNPCRVIVSAANPAVAVGSASSVLSGLVDTIAQTFSGIKSFTDGINVGAGGTVAKLQHGTTDSYWVGVVRLDTGAANGTLDYDSPMIYSRIGNTVHCGGHFRMDLSAAVDSRVTINLPFARSTNFDSQGQPLVGVVAHGLATSTALTAGSAGWMTGFSTSTSTVAVDIPDPTGTTNYLVYFNFTYQLD